MALEKQNISISFDKGVDTKRDPKQIALGKLLVLKNGFFKAINKIQKRYGFDRLAQSGEMSSGNMIAPYANELVGCDGANVYSYSASEAKMDIKGSKVAVGVANQSIVANNYNQSDADSAINSNIQCFVYGDSSTSAAKYTIIDSSTGQKIVDNVDVSTTAYYAKVKAIGSYFVIVYIDYSDNKLKYKAINIATPTTLGSAVTIATDITSYWVFDIAVLGSTMYIAYDSSSGVGLYSLSSALSLSAKTTATAQDANYGIAVYTDSVLNEVWVNYVRSTLGIRYFVYNSTLSTQVLAPTSIETVADNFTNITGYASNGSGYGLWTGVAQTNLTYDSNTLETSYVRKMTLTRTGTVGTPAYLNRGVFICGKPFAYGSDTYYLAGRYSQEQPTYFLINSSGTVVAKATQDNSNPYPMSGKHLTEVNTVSSNVFMIAGAYKENLNVISGVAYSQSSIQAMTFTFGQALVNQSIANNLHISGGILSMYDGSNIVEHGFHQYPENVYYGPQPGTGALEMGSSYSYKVCYEWTDNQGQIHRSAPSTGVSKVSDSTITLPLATTTLGSAAIATAYNPGLYGISVGMAVTGTGIPADTYIIGLANNSIAISNNATANGTTVLQITRNLKATGSTTAGYPYLDTSMYRYLQFYAVETVPQSTSILVDADFAQLLKHDMELTNIATGTTVLVTAGYTGFTYGPGGLAIIPTTSGGALASGQYLVTNRIYATFTAGVNTFTISATDLDRICIGIDIRVGTTTHTVTNIVGTTVTVGTNFVSNTNNAIVSFPQSFIMRVGHKVVNSGFTGTVKVTAAPRSYLGSPFRVTVDANATSTVASQLTTITNCNGSFLVIPDLRLTQKSNVRCVIYRTEAGGSRYYQVTSVTLPLLNITTNDFTFYYDTMSDTTLIGNNVIYTDGGVLENDPLPASNIMTAYKNRIISVPSEHPFTWWFSKQVVPGGVAEFSASFVKNIDQRDGGITGLGVIDEKLLLFKANTIFCVVGDGPSPSGFNDDFIDAQLVTTDAGCANHKSIVRTPAGLMFQSSKGIYLMDRSLSVNYVGDAVEAYNAYTVTSSKLISTLNQVRFTMSNGVVLVYDYYVGQWSVFDSISAVDSCEFGGQFTWLKSNGKIYKENPSVFTDDGAFIQLYIQTGWIQMAGIQGFQRIYKALLVGDYKSPHTLNCELTYDFVSTVAQTITVPVASAPSGVPYQYRLFPSRQKCEAMQFTLYDTQSPSYGEGLSLSALSFEVGIKRGLNKVSESQSYG